MNKSKKGSNLYITPEGLPFIGIALLFCVFSAVIGLKIIFVACVALTLFVIYFFRNPERDITNDDRAIVSPADGRIIKVEECKADGFLNGYAKKISIFMSVFNVHVNRVPVSGVVKKIAYNPGSFVVASLDKASELNERNAILVETKNGVPVLFVQVAGLIARRIVCYLKEGDEVLKGSRFGMIRFGSRLDVYLPLDCCIEVEVGDRVKSGSTVLGRL